MPIFRRDKDPRRVVSFPDKTTAQETLRLLAKSGSLQGSKKPSKAESAATRSEIKDIQADATYLANYQGQLERDKYSATKNSVELSKKGHWLDENKPNFEGIRHAQEYPAKNSPVGIPGEAYSGPPKQQPEMLDPWATK